jgi:hypothetical protein
MEPRRRSRERLGSTDLIDQRMVLWPLLSLILMNRASARLSCA